MNKEGINKLGVRAYLYCEDCQTFLDYWKYDSLVDTGHDKCNWRYVTEEELKGCIEDCESDGCFNEVFL